MTQLQLPPMLLLPILRLVACTEEELALALALASGACAVASKSLTRLQQ